ncbi:cytochrome c oxidase assembly protein [Phenylobacterium sp.]|uniref:cytochrome c oxidase assembly protein n=1 Tax=Phenylobacterium sp. TaxID=1871053 RepID=UPI0035B4C714
MIRLALLLALLPGAALAHAPEPTGWGGPEAWIAAPWLLTAALYGAGFLRLWRRSTTGRAELARRGRIFAAGLATLAVSSLSPLHALSGRSFTAHMIEHELIMLAAAPLFVWSRPLGVMLWAFPARGRQGLAAVPRSRAGAGLWRFFSDPLLSTTLQAAAVWVWHLPSLFDRALKHEGWHAAQHLSFFVTALLFWSAMLGPRRNVWVAAFCLFATSMVTGALGAFMALSESPWYGPYAALGLAAFGLTPAEDQQLAGLLMWVPGGLFHAVVAAALLAPHLRGTPLKEAQHG